MLSLTKLLRFGEGRMVKRLKHIAEHVESIAPEFESLTDAELQAKTAEFRGRLQDGETLDDLLPERSRRPGKHRSVSSVRSTTPCRSWVALHCTSATSPR